MIYPTTTTTTTIAPTTTTTTTTSTTTTTTTTTTLESYEYTVSAPTLSGESTDVDYYDRYGNAQFISLLYGGGSTTICASSIISVNAGPGGGISGPGSLCFY
jgi:hypothetical protein